MSITFQSPCFIGPSICPFCMRLVPFSSCQNPEALYQLPRLEYFVIATQNCLNPYLLEVKLSLVKFPINSMLFTCHFILLKYIGEIWAKNMISLE